MAFCDFIVSWNSEEETQVDLTRKILYSILVSNLKNKKPVRMFIGGDSGEGKSFTALTIAIEMLEMQGIDVREFFSTINIYSPLQYTDKMNKILFDKEYKKVNTCIVHEARDLVNAKNWHSFLNQATADINAMSRSIKPLCLIIVSQFIRDIDKTIRYTLTHYCKVFRPKGKRARLYINILWKDDRDLDNPKIRKRRLTGFIIDKKGKYRRVSPEYIELPKPPKDLVERFEREDKEAKAISIRGKLDKLIKQMKMETGEEDKKIDIMVDWYSGNPEQIHLIGKRLKKGWKLNPKFRDMHDLTIDESKIFENKLNLKLKELGAIKDEE